MTFSFVIMTIMITATVRKPKPGLLLEASKKWDIDLKSSYMIGDRWKDIEAGKSAGV